MRLNKDKLEFIYFWQNVANEVGSSRLKLNLNAKSINDLIAANSDAKKFLHQAIKDTYRLSRCHNLYSPIDLDAVLDILGQIAFDLRDAEKDDLFDIELLEEIAWHVSLVYPKGATKEMDNDSTDTSSKKSCVISFPEYKIRQANSRK